MDKITELQCEIYITINRMDEVYKFKNTKSKKKKKKICQRIENFVWQYSKTIRVPIMFAEYVKVILIYLNKIYHIILLLFTFTLFIINLTKNIFKNVI